MKTGERLSRPRAAALLGVVMVLYFGLYAWLCVPPRYSGAHPLGPIVRQEIPSYKYGGRISKIIFWPAWKIDTLLFPPPLDSTQIHQ